MTAVVRRRSGARLWSRVRGVLPRGNRLDHESWQRRHHGILLLLAVMTIFIPVVAIHQGYSVVHGLADAIPVFTIAGAAFSIRRSRRWASSLATLGLWAATAGYVHLAGGLIEAHFLFFVLLGVVTLYQDWLAYLLAIAFTAVHHGVMGAVDPAAVYNHPAALHAPVRWALIHAAFVVAASVANLVAWKASEELALRDSLTKLPNRRLLNERVDAAVTNGPTAVLFIDLCEFKNINDSFGHETGDAVLRQVAERLRRVVRKCDTVARFGGDEFVVVIEDGDEDVARGVAQRALEALAEPLTLNGIELCIGASIGIAFSGADGNTTSTLLRNADTAMYAAKRAGGPGGSYARFTASMEEAIATRLAMESDLRHAVRRDELRLFYQPLIRIEDGAVIGAEALLRWQHPVHGLVAPAEFIPLAEETGAIVRIGAWVLEEACRAAARWPAAEDGTQHRISVNISDRQLRDGDLIGTVSGALIRSGLSPSALCLEITESLLMVDVERSSAVLHELKALGVTLSVDDFGTGHSSLARLKTFHVDELKIDRSFVSGLPADVDDEAIVTSIVGLAHAMGIAVLAEGVEDERQLAVLHRVRCEVGQGWLWSRAVPESEFLEFLGRNRPTSSPPKLTASRTKAHPGPARVLIVDDDPAQRELARMLLRASGNDVTVVGEPAQFVEVLRQVEPDLVLMDLHMPGRGGLDLVQDMADAGQTVTVVAVSAHIDWLSRPLCGADRFAGAIAKPIDPESFAGQVHGYLTAPLPTPG